MDGLVTRCIMGKRCTVTTEYPNRYIVHQDKMSQVRFQSLIDSFRFNLKAISLRMERRHHSLGAKQNCYFLPKRTRETTITNCNELTI
jgi:hypothetical protein